MGKCLLKSSLCRKCKRDAKDHVHKKVVRQLTPSSSSTSPAYHHATAAARRYKVVRIEPKRPPGIRYAFVRRALRQREQNAYKVNRKRKFTSWRRTTSSVVCIYVLECVCVSVYVLVCGWMYARAFSRLIYGFKFKLRLYSILLKP